MQIVHILVNQHPTGTSFSICIICATATWSILKHKKFSLCNPAGIIPFLVKWKLKVSRPRRFGPFRPLTSTLIIKHTFCRYGPVPLTWEQLADLGTKAKLIPSTNAAVLTASLLLAWTSEPSVFFIFGYTPQLITFPLQVFTFFEYLNKIRFAFSAPVLFPESVSPQFVGSPYSCSANA